MPEDERVGYDADEESPTDEMLQYDFYTEAELEGDWDT